MTGIVNIDKPMGRTSHFVVAVIRRITKIKKVGHTGTLDPLATGVLPICIGRESTKLSQVIMDGTKGYRAVVKLGVTTNTQDREGEVLQTRPVTVSEDQITSCLKEFEGEIFQIPPMYSAIKIDGKKLYELARKGLEVERPPRRVTIDSIRVRHFDLDQDRFTIDVLCSKGTYIRTLCQDIGDKLGCGAHMESLIRTKCGRFELKDSISLEAFEALWKAEAFDQFLMEPSVFTEDEKKAGNDAL